MNTKYTFLTPSDATIQYCNKKNGCELNEVNDMCYSLSSAWNDNCNAWDIPYTDAKGCELLVNEYRYKTFGVGKCDHSYPNRPLLKRSLHFFPDIFKKNNDKEKALFECRIKCNFVQDKQECRDNCLNDSSIVIEKPSNTINGDTINGDTINKQIVGRNRGIFSDGPNYIVTLKRFVLIFITLIIFIILIALIQKTVNKHF